MRLISAYSPTGDMFDLESESSDDYSDLRLAQLYQHLTDLTEQHFAEKRDDSSVSTLTQVLSQVESSGVIISVLEEIANSPTQINNLANLAESLIRNGGGVVGGLNISLNMSSLLKTVKDSGIIFTTLDGLMLNVTNRNFLADRLGVLLKRNPWVAQLLTDLGAGKALTVAHIADLVQNFTSKASNWDEMLQQTESVTSKSVVIGARDDSSGQYAGSAQEFLNNLINTVASSTLASQSIGDILQAVNDSGIVVPIVVDVLNSTAILRMVGTLVGKIYNTGAFDNIDLNSYYQLAKKNGLLTNSIQIALTDPTYSPPLARIFQRMEINGAYQQTQWNLHGGPDKKK